MSDRAALRLSCRLLAGVLSAAAVCAQAQSASCSSDARPRPTAVLERFMDADCQECWQSAQAAKPPKGALVLDWVLPSAKGDEAAMSAVALSEGLERLQALGLHMTEPMPSRLTRRQPGQAPALRVAQGFAFNGYLGAILRYQPRTHEPYTAWLLLVEQLPAGTEGSPVARQLVRAAAQVRPGTVNGRPAPLNDVRAFLLPEGAQPDRLRVVGWVQDGQGRLLALGQTHC